ncbi:hypothetical protein KSP40_PGU021014 [Platanthera guangdongensis]|uniref:Helicase MOV-10-like beta-barrel domain-containing protein n=1 Tax=Platanthera guangdongensis TaxID=2320717 RepID=A0ABR2LZR7_9ASPA
MRLFWTLGGIAAAAVLLRLLRCIISPGQDDEEQRFDDNRTDRDYTPISPPDSPSTSEPPRSYDTAEDPLLYRLDPLLYPLYRDDDRTSLPPTPSNIDSRGNLKPPVVASHGGGNQTLYSPTGSSEKPIASTPFSSSVIRVPSNPSLASKPSPAPISSTNINTSVIKLSIGLEKLQIAKDSATCSLVKLSATRAPSKFQAPSISSSAAPAPSSKKTSLSVASSTNKVSAVGIPICPEKFQTSPDSAISTPERSHIGTLLPKFSSPSFSSSTTDSSSTTLQSKVSLSTKLSPAPPSKPFPAPISAVNNSFSGDVGRIWRKKKNQSSSASIRESQQNIYSASLSSIEVPSPDSSLSGSSSPSPEPRRSNRSVLPKYEIPKYLEELIKKDIVPPILKCPLSPLTYGDYFATLLYAEDFYLEKWSDYLLEDVTLELRPRDGHSQAITVKRKNSTPDSRDYIAFKLEDIPEERPFLLSRDFVFLRPPNSSAESFKGILFRVVRSIVLVEFGDDFHSQHSPSKKYDVSFSFNRVCLKRAHQAISISADPSFQSILFPERSLSPHLRDRIPSFQDPARRIANHRGPIPFLLQGQLVTEQSPTGRVLQLAMLNIYRANPKCRILVCSPTNKTSDVLLRSLRERIPEASFFRANAAFRDYNLVPTDIVPASLYEEEQECFSCPPLSELLNFNIVTSTFISSFRLSSAGIDSDHFSHIFLVDACLAIEPEAIVPLANLACGDTAVVVAGCSGKSPGWVRSEIARRNGLKESYFSRLLGREPYRSGDAMFTLEVLD